MDLALRPITEVAIVGRLDDPGTAALVAETRREYRPGQVVAVAEEAASSAIPLLADRLAIDGRPTAFVCRSFACRLPVTEPDALRAELRAAGQPDVVGPFGAA